MFFENYYQRQGRCLECGRYVTVHHFTLDGKLRVWREDCACSDGDHLWRDDKAVVQAIREAENGAA